MRIKNKLAIGLGAIITTSSLFTGCSVFHNQSKQELNENETVVLKNSINLDENSISKDDVTKATNVLNDLYKGLDQKELKDFSTSKTDEEILSLNKKIIKPIDVLDESCKNGLVNDLNNPFVETFRNSIKNPGDKLWSISLTGIGFEATDKTNKIVIGDMNFVSDNPGFKIQPFKFTLDKDNKIIKVEKFGKEMNQANTRTPLNNNSNINGDLNVNFKTSLNTLLKKLDNKPVYENLIQNPKKISDVENLISSINMKDVSKDTLISLFKAFNGCEKGHYGITEYIHSDLNADGESQYVLSIPVGNKVEKYSINYNRITDKITGINLEQ